MRPTPEMKKLKKDGASYSEIAEKIGVAKSTVYKAFNPKKNKTYYTDEYKRKKVKTVKKEVTTNTSINCGIGISRETIKMKHDTPSRIVSELERFLNSMKPEKAYEENEVLRICKIGNNDREYWEQITSTPGYTKYQGYTEKGIRLWALESEQEWLQENVTGYRRAL